MNKYIVRLVNLFGLLLLTACGQTTKQTSVDQGLDLVTSFYPVYALVRQVSGDLNQVSMIDSGAGIHGFEPSVADVKKIHDADAFIYHSHILEAWAGRLDQTLGQSRVKLLEAGADLPLERVTGLENFQPKAGMDVSSLYDPHTWTDPILVGQEAVLIAQLLSDLDPSNASIYQTNARAIQTEAEELVAEFAPKFEALDQKTFVTQHTAFSYLARRFGLTQLGIAGVTNEEPSPRQLAEVKTFIDTYQVETIFTESNLSDKLAQSLASSTGVQFKPLDTLESAPKEDKPFLTHLRLQLERLVEGLGT